MKTLITKLQEFNYAQLDKFVKRINKHPNNSVTEDKQFYNSIRDNQKAVIDHLVEEFCEYFNLNSEHYIQILEMIKQQNNSNRAYEYGYKEELVDIANLAFLIWCISD